MKNFFLSLFAVWVSYASFAQTEDLNQEKYWNYRNRLISDFVKVGKNQGESIPMSARSIGFAYDGVPLNAEGRKPSRIYYQDATIYIGHYLILLATENKFLREEIQSATEINKVLELQKKLEQNKVECYFALETINRLDDYAEAYLTQNQISSVVRNGLFLRDDVPPSMIENYLNDQSIPFERPADFILTHSDFRPVVDYNNPDEEEIAGTLVEFQPNNVMSLDQISSLLLGLKTFMLLVPDYTVQPTPQDGPIQLVGEAQAIALRIISHVMHEASEVAEDPILPGQPDELGLSFVIRNVDGFLVPRGSDATFFAPAIIKYAQFFNHPLLVGMDDNEIRNINVAIQVDPSTMNFDNICDEIINTANNTPGTLGNALEQAAAFLVEGGCNLTGCFQNLENLRNDLVNNNDMMTVGEIKMGALMDLLQAMEDYNIIIEQYTDECLPLAPLINTIDAFNFDIKYYNCDNVTEAILKALKCIIIVKAPLLSAGFLTSLSFLADNATICLSDISSQLIQNVNDDNIHMFLEFGTGANLWANNNYISEFGIASNFRWYSMLDALINNSQISPSMSKADIETTLLNLAPCEGPWDDPATVVRPTEGTAPNWRAANNLFHPKDAPIGIETGSFRGEFSGLDYMVYHNLYYNTWKSSLPPFYPNLSCGCVQEITSEITFNSLLQVKPKFPDYVTKKLDLPKFLAHDLTFSGATGILQVEEDLVVCRSNPAQQTNLVMDLESSLVIHRGAELRVKEGNRVIIKNSAVLRAGVYNSYDPTAEKAEIYLEKNAELFVNSADLISYAGLQIYLEEGSKLVFDNADLSSGVCCALNINSLGENVEVIFRNNSTFVGPNFDFVGIVLTFPGNILTVENSLVDLSNVSLELKDMEMNINEANVSFFQGIGYAFDSEIIMTNSDFQLDHFTFDATSSTNVFQNQTNLYINESGLQVSNNSSNENSGSTWYYNGGDFQLNGFESSFTMKNSLLEVEAYRTLEITHPESGNGFVEIIGVMNEDIRLNPESHFIFKGDDITFPLLKITDYSDLWIPADYGSFHIENGLVDLSNNGRIWLSPEFDAWNIDFFNANNSQDSEIECWYNNSIIKFCKFRAVGFTGFGSQLSVTQSSYHQPLSRINMFGGSYNLTLSEFYNSGITSERLDRVSNIVNTKFFEGHGQHNYVAIQDVSLVDVNVNNCSIQDYKFGVHKMKGKLNLRCNNFNNNITAVYGESTILNLAGNQYAGYNNFIDNSYNIEAKYVNTISLDKGYNRFEPYEECNISILSTQPCNPSQVVSIPANANIWTVVSGVNVPLPNTPAAGVCYAETYPSGCTVEFYDLSPATSNACPTDKPVVKPKNLVSAGANGLEPFAESANLSLRNLVNDPNNPLINTTSFVDVPLDSALSIAASLLEVYDSLGNNSQAIQFFSEILNSNLDRNNSEVRYLFNWGLTQMKSGIEDMFNKGQLDVENNISSFESIVDHYVDILNLATDTVLTNETYRSQFTTELYKGQLFLTLDKKEIASQVFSNLGNCDLDSLEQSILNFWIQECQLALQIKSQYLLGIASDSMSLSVDSSQFIAPTALSTSDYYFGATIHDPNTVSFVSCGSNPTYRNLITNFSGLNVFPNPTVETLTIQLDNSETLFTELTIFDSYGKKVRSQKLNSNEVVNLQLNVSELARGNYFIQLSNSEASITRYFVKMD